MQKTSYSNGKSISETVYENPITYIIYADQLSSTHHIDHEDNESMNDFIDSLKEDPLLLSNRYTYKHIIKFINDVGKSGIKLILHFINQINIISMNNNILIKWNKIYKKISYDLAIMLH